MVELVAVGIEPPLPPGLDYEGSVLVVDGVSFDGGPSSLAALEGCPVRSKALVSKVGQPASIADLRAEQSRANPEGHRYVVDNAYLSGPAESLVPALTPAFGSLPTAKSFSLWFDLAHLPRRPLPDMALSLQTDLYFATYVVSSDPAQDELCRSWIDNTMARLAPFSPGVYLGDSDLAVRQAPFMSDAAWARFQATRAVRDPDGLFAGYLA
jgi:FAD/FMN-containing dehydrogenase